MQYQVQGVRFPARPRLLLRDTAIHCPNTSSVSLLPASQQRYLVPEGFPASRYNSAWGPARPVSAPFDFRCSPCSASKVPAQFMVVYPVYLHLEATFQPFRKYFHQLLSSMASSKARSRRCSISVFCFKVFPCILMTSTSCSSSILALISFTSSLASL